MSKVFLDQVPSRAKALKRTPTKNEVGAFKLKVNFFSIKIIQTLCIGYIKYKQ